MQIWISKEPLYLVIPYEIIKFMLMFLLIFITYAIKILQTKIEFVINADMLALDKDLFRTHLAKKNKRIGFWKAV